MKKIIYSPGEPSGIGPDLIIKLSSSNSWEDFKIPIVSIGDPKLFLDRAALLKKKIRIIEHIHLVNNKLLLISNNSYFIEIDLKSNLKVNSIKKNPFDISSNIIFLDNEMIFVNDSKKVYRVN